MLATMCPDIVFARLPVILTCGIVTALLGFILIKIEFHSHPLSVGSHAKKGIGYPMRVLISIVPSYTTLRHEDTKSRMGDLLLVYFLETDTEYYPKGSTTFRQQEHRGGTEADESYCIGTDKAVPDLAIEVVVTSGGLNRLEVYSR